jgi:hypothetical protein
MKPGALVGGVPWRVEGDRPQSFLLLQAAGAGHHPDVNRRSNDRLRRSTTHRKADLPVRHSIPEIV